MTYRIYAINSYSGWTNDKINTEFQEYELEELINILKFTKNNKGYHQRIDPTKNYQFFGDCDKYRKTFDDFSNILVDFLKKYYDINIKKEDISYTENKSVKHVVNKPEDEGEVFSQVVSTLLPILLIGFLFLMMMRKVGPVGGGGGGSGGNEEDFYAGGGGGALRL